MYNIQQGFTYGPANSKKPKHLAFRKENTAPKGVLLITQLYCHEIRPKCENIDR